MSKISLATVTNGQNISAMNANFTAIAAALNNQVLYRANVSGEPNQIENDIDFNGFNILNGGQASYTKLTVASVDVFNIVQQAQVAQTGAETAEAAAQAAQAASQTSANASEASHQAAVVSAAQAAQSATDAAAAAGRSGSLIAANNLSDVVSQSAALTNLLGASIIPLVNGGTGASTAVTARTNLGLGTASTVNTGTSGATIPLNNGINTWANTQTIAPASTSAILALNPIASKNAVVSFYSNSSQRWDAGKSTADDYNIVRYVTGTLTDIPFTISNSTGIATFLQSPLVPTATAGDNTTKAASTAFVAALAATKNPLINSTASAIGQITAINAATGVAFTFPTVTGASWAYVVQYFNTSTGAFGTGIGTSAGVAASGSTLAGVASFQITGFAIRLS